MAKRNHDLDGKIEKAAFADFLENGFSGASLRKIAAAADVTIGALYTRYKTKDILFCSLVNPLVTRIQEVFGEIKTEYETDTVTDLKEGLLMGVKAETDAILHLLFDDYDRATLLFCKSEGSSLSGFFALLTKKKTEETERFFAKYGDKKPDVEAIELLISSEFYMISQVIGRGYSETRARQIIHTVMTYRLGGWTALFT